METRAMLGVEHLREVIISEKLIQILVELMQKTD